MSSQRLALIGTAVVLVVAVVITAVVLARSKSSALVPAADQRAVATIRETVTMPALPQKAITLPASTVTATVTATV
ncbi:hypothetical protein ACFQ1S_30665, partial [Kibdelosporangium lantanae]